MYVISRPFGGLITLTDSKYHQEEHPDFVAPPPLHVFSLAGWIQLCIRANVLDIGLHQGLAPGAYVTLQETVVERLSPDEFVWNSSRDTSLEPLHFYLVEHDAFLQALKSGRVKPVEMGGELAEGHTIVCEPLSKEVIDLNQLFEEE